MGFDGKGLTVMYYLIAAALVALDQVTKFLVRSSLALGEQVVLIPHVLALNYVQNTGMAFASFSGRATLLGLLSLLVSVVLVVVIAKRLLFRHPMGLTALTLILAGAVGNLLDRLFLGYVTDMIEVLFLNFYIFNVADCCVVIGGILMAIYVLFFYDKWEKC